MGGIFGDDEPDTGAGQARAAKAKADADKKRLGQLATERLRERLGSRGQKITRGGTSGGTAKTLGGGKSSASGVGLGGGQSSTTRSVKGSRAAGGAIAPDSARGKQIETNQKIRNSFVQPSGFMGKVAAGVVGGLQKGVIIQPKKRN